MLMFSRKSRSRKRRRGATVVEFAIVGPVFFLLLIGFCVLTMGVYRYQQVAWLARLATRYASVHGAQYRADNGLAAGTSSSWTSEIGSTAVIPNTSTLDPNLTTVSAEWATGDNRANAADSATNSSTSIPNWVTVTVRYQWTPLRYLVGPISLTSTASAPVSY